MTTPAHSSLTQPRAADSLPQVDSLRRPLSEWLLLLTLAAVQFTVAVDFVIMMPLGPQLMRIFEIHTAATNRGEIDFITMEFLDGPTLTERLRDGPLPEREARIIAQQLCPGLAAAHRSHVIHGDLKSNNVILTKAADGSHRAVITDFGLAHGIQPQAGNARREDRAA